MKPAYEGSAIVIMDKQYYIDEEIRQLPNTDFYVEVPMDISGDVMQRINLHVHDISNRGQITDQTATYLTTDVDRTHLSEGPFLHLTLSK